MSRSYACGGLTDSLISRRKLLAIGGAGMLGLTLPRLAMAKKQGKAAPKAKADSVIFLYQFGGPSHLDTFDMKPQAPEGIRGPLKATQSVVPGLPVVEHLPEMAKVMDKVTLVRSMTHKMKNHNSASYYALTGHAPPLDDIRLRDSIELYPAYGSVVDHLASRRDNMPTFAAFPHVIRDGSITPGQHASFLGKTHDPLLITDDPSKSNFRLPELSLPSGVSVARLDRRRRLQKLIDQQTGMLERSAKTRGLDAYYERALAMITSSKVRQAFDLSKEPGKLRDKYGRHTYGQSCLLARRLVEAGVKFVNVYFSNSIGGQSTTSGGWDTHGFNNTRMFPIVKKRHFPITDQTLPTLLRDLDDRGLLDRTLIVWMGRVRAHAENQQEPKSRSLAAVLYDAASRRRRETRLCIRRFGSRRRVSRARSGPA